tara:strand:- start:226 stop:378 length:153 start_codon:yes stop_codon:yes gene_type:complete
VGALIDREQEQRSVALPKQQYNPLGFIVTECKDIDRRWTEWTTMGLEIVV